MTVQTISPPRPIIDAPLLTGEALCHQPELGPGELVEGVFRSMPPPGYQHGMIEFRMGKLLSNFVDQWELGYVLGGEAGVYTQRNPDTVRGMDAAFISHERMAQVRSDTYLDVAPELVVEVLSPHDLWRDVNNKLGEYFAIGVQLVWVIDPRQQMVHVYRALTDLDILHHQDTLDGGQVLLGFQISVAAIFE